MEKSLNWSEFVITRLIRASGYSAILFVALIFLFLILEGLPTLSEVDLRTLVSSRWYPIEDYFGIIPLITGSLIVTFGAALIAVPFGIGTAIYISEIAPRWVREILKPLVELLGGLPSVVLGFLGILVLSPYLRVLLDLPTGLTAAIFITLLSCINFMNLSTAQFTRRLKEASVRKILGLGKIQLSFSYFMEAVAFCLIALVAAIGLTQLLLPAFNLITEKSLKLNLFSDTSLLLGLAGLVLFMALVSGSYPALFLSSFHPVEAIKGKVRIGSEGKVFRNGLVVFQFCVSIVLIICTAIVFQQLKFVSDKEIGFNRENLLVINHAGIVKNAESITNEVLNVPGVASSTLCASVPPRLWNGDSFGIKEKSDLRLNINFTNADEQYIPTLGIHMKLGRNFSKDIPGDVDRVIVNEALVKKIGWPIDESVLGKIITYENAEFEVVGVVSDFNYWSLINPIEPMAIFHINKLGFYSNEKQLVLRMKSLDGESWEKTIASVGALWKKHAGDTPFDYYFVDQAFAEAFKSQQQFGKVLTVMATLAIMIAALGLLGMIIYALEQRTKEIGIRKVSGASVWDILKLISKGYTKLIVVAFIIGAPFSYWLMQQWLSDFAYRITPSLWIFAITGLSTLLVAILITSYHSMKAALTNPVEVLKDE
jgi:putative ABC transport system permease protein